MKQLLFSFIALVMMSGAAFGDGLIISFNPASQEYPAGADTAQCQLNGVAPCVIFSGTLTDTDTDQSFLFLNSIAVVFDLPAAANFFTVDNTFSNNVPGLLVGDVNWLTNGLPAPNTYTGPIFALDIAPLTPAATYTAIAVIIGAGGASDPTDQGFVVQQSFSVTVAPALLGTPEPGPGALALAGLIAIAARHRLWRYRTS